MSSEYACLVRRVLTLCFSGLGVSTHLSAPLSCSRLTWVSSAHLYSRKNLPSENSRDYWNMALSIISLWSCLICCCLTLELLYILVLVHLECLSKCPCRLWWNHTSEFFYLCIRVRYTSLESTHGVHMYILKQVPWLRIKLPLKQYDCLLYCDQTFKLHVSYRMTEWMRKPVTKSLYFLNIDFFKKEI